MEKKKKLLIAEDEKPLHDAYAEILSPDFEILHAYDGAEALMIAVEELPAIILLDIMMPILDGRTLCQKLKDNPKTKDIKIIMLTAKSEQHDRIVGYEVGADDYIVKPCPMEDLSHRIKRVLR